MSRSNKADKASKEESQRLRLRKAKSLMEQATNIVDGFEEGTFDDAITMYRDAYDLFEGALLFGGKYKQFIQKSIDEAQNYIDHLEELLEERADRRQVQPQRRQVQQQRQVPQRRHEVLELALAERKSNRRDSDDDPDELSDGLPDELKRFGKDLVEKIENEIMESGDAVSFDEIAGLVDQKQTVQEVVCWPLKRPELFTGLRTMPNGLLLFGPPGTGKTMLGKAIAFESEATFFSISSASLASKWLGEGEKLVQVLFAVASYRQPAVIFVEEIDSLLAQRTADENEATRRIKAAFNECMDGIGTNGQGRVLVIGTTRHPQDLDEAARRRFTKRLYIPLPETDDREILIRNLLTKDNHCLVDAEVQALVRATDGFSGADLKALCSDAAMGPIQQLGSRALKVEVKDVPPILYKHFCQAVKNMKPSVSADDLAQYVEWNKLFGSNPCDQENDDDDNSSTGTNDA